MNLYLYSKSPDKSLAASTLSDLQALIAALADPLKPANAATINRVQGNIEEMVQNDSGEPLVIAAYDDASTVASWVTDAGTTLAVGLGGINSQASLLYAATADFSIVGSTRVGVLSLNTQELTNALAGLGCARGYGPSQATLYLHIRKTTAGVTETVGLVPISVSATVLAGVPSSVPGTAALGPVTTSGLTMTTARLLGRTTAATGAIEEIQVGSGLTLAAGILSLSDTSPVSSVAGTTGEITASPTAGDVILSLPGALVFTGKTIDGGTFTAGAFNGTIGATTPDAGTFTTVTLTGTTLTVPDAFNLLSAGSIDLTAAVNENVTFTTSGTGQVRIGDAAAGDSPDTLAKIVAGADGSSAPIVVISYGGSANFRGFAATGTRASPSFPINGTTLGGVTGGGWFNGAFSASSKGFFTIAGDATWTNTSTPTRLAFGVTPVGTTTAFTPVLLRSTGVLSLGIASKSQPAWGVVGAHLEVQGNTVTDSTSATGTVATAVFNSLAVPTLNSTNASVVYTNLANLYIAGDVATTGNASATNSYGLWNVGKTRLDGAVQLPSTNTSGLQLYNTADQVTNYERLEMVWTDGNTIARVRTVAGGSGANRGLTIGSANNFISLNPGSSTTGALQLTTLGSSLAGNIGIRLTSATATAYTQTSGTNVFASLTPTYNQASGTAANDDLSVIRTETAIQAGTLQRLLNLGTTALGSQFAVNNRGGLSVSYQSLSGAGAVNVTNYSTELTSSGVLQALTLADGVAGQIKVIVHGVAGGSMVLTPTTKTGFSTVTFTNAGDSVTLQFFTTRGWMVIGSYLAVIAP